MIQWIDCLGRSWGYQIRRRAKTDVSLPSLAGKLAELGPEGCMVSNPVQVYSESLLGDALVFNIAFQHLSSFKDRQILALHYIDRTPAKAKCHLLRIARPTYYQRLDAAHNHISLILAYADAIQLKAAVEI